MVGSIAGAGAVSAATAAPDLVVVAVDRTAGAVAGQQVRFTATIENRGTAPTPAGTIAGIGFQVDGKLVSWADQVTYSLRPGDSVTISAVGGPQGSATWTATAGDHTLRAFVDDAGRIKESNEANNTRDVTLPVSSGLATRTQDRSTTTSLRPLNRPTVISTTVTGTLFGGCFTADGFLLDGTERAVSRHTVGNERPALGSKWGTEGVVQIPANAVRAQTPVPFSELLWSYQGHYPFECAPGSTPRFSRFQAASVKTNRFEGSFATTVGAQIASVTTAVDTDFDVQP
ncbi:CARDB protein [Kineococcus rhizosphaerae]|uniref:CARDB protein n=1 Tax=Kineococcus rhizosphaerae TaxID=559628 RepID=A0A2T0R4S2_9ACTN|nr:CARDB protein [Kineococcus rhizosphaerae]